MGEPTTEPGSLEPLVAAAVARAGFELDELDVVGAGQRRPRPAGRVEASLRLRVVVDSENGVGSDDIATISREVSADLDRQDGMLTGPYTLEVTSPGVERPLTRPRHWRRNRLRLVRAHYRDGTEIVGRVGDCDDEAVTMLVSGSPRRVPFADLERAAVEVEFRPPPAAELAALERSGAEDPQHGN